MYRNINPAVEQRLFDLLREEALALELMQRPVDLGVALGFDHDDLSRSAQPAANPLRLPASELAAARPDLHANRRTSASTSPSIVCGIPMMMSFSPTSRAVFAVMGPMAAETNRPAVAVSGPTRSTNARTVDD